MRLREKHRLRYYHRVSEAYGVSEAQLRRYVCRAASKPGTTGVNLLSTLECRLDSGTRARTPTERAHAAARAQ